jgi:hypothetical protein
MTGPLSGRIDDFRSPDNIAGPTGPARHTPVIMSSVVTGADLKRRSVVSMVPIGRPELMGQKAARFFGPGQQHGW